MKYKILHNYMYGWDIAWLNENEEPELYDTIEEAQTDIDDLIDDVKEAVKLGHMEHRYDKEDYKVVGSNWRYQ